MWSVITLHAAIHMMRHKRLPSQARSRTSLDVSLQADTHTERKDDTRIHESATRETILSVLTCQATTSQRTTAPTQSFTKHLGLELK